MTVDDVCHNQNNSGGCLIVDDVWIGMHDIRR